MRRQPTLPAGTNQANLPAFVTCRDTARISEGVGPKIHNLHHVVAAVRIRHAQDDRLGCKIEKAEAIEGIDVWRDVTGLLRKLGRRDVLHPPDRIHGGGCGPTESLKRKQYI